MATAIERNNGANASNRTLSSNVSKPATDTAANGCEAAASCVFLVLGLGFLTWFAVSKLASAVGGASMLDFIHCVTG